MIQFFGMNFDQKYYVKSLKKKIILPLYPLREGKNLQKVGFMIHWRIDNEKRKKASSFFFYHLVWNESLMHGAMNPPVK